MHPFNFVPRRLIPCSITAGQAPRGGGVAVTGFRRFSCSYIPIVGPGSSVGMTDYGLDGPGSNPDGDEIFRPSRPALGPHPASFTMGDG